MSCVETDAAGTLASHTASRSPPSAQPHSFLQPSDLSRRCTEHLQCMTEALMVTSPAAKYAWHMQEESFAACRKVPQIKVSELDAKLSTPSKPIHITASVPDLHIHSAEPSPEAAGPAEESPVKATGHSRSPATTASAASSQPRRRLTFTAVAGRILQFHLNTAQRVRHCMRLLLCSPPHVGYDVWWTGLVLSNSCLLC